MKGQSRLNVVICRMKMGCSSRAEVEGRMGCGCLGYVMMMLGCFQLVWVVLDECVVLWVGWGVVWVGTAVGVVGAGCLGRTESRKC